MCKSRLVPYVYVSVGERPFECEHCGRRYPRLDQLRDHKRVHTGERPYKCTMCDKTFGLNASMRRHMLIHTGERRFSNCLYHLHWLLPVHFCINCKIATGVPDSQFLNLASAGFANTNPAVDGVGSVDCVINYITTTTATVLRPPVLCPRLPR